MIGGTGDTSKGGVLLVFLRWSLETYPWVYKGSLVVEGTSIELDCWVLEVLDLLTLNY